MDSFKGKKGQIFGKLKAAEHYWDEDRGNEGILAGREARRRLQEKKRLSDTTFKQELSEMVETTAK
jgi:hypothetical protein